MAGESRQLFISYARVDAQRVDALIEGLRQLHYDAWVDQKLTGGQAWWDAVLSQVRASSAVLVAVSPAALESVAVLREYEYGHAVGRPLLPVIIARVQLEILPSHLASLQVLDYRQPSTKSAFALAAALAALPAPQALPRPLPDPPPIPISYLSGLKERTQAATLSMDEQLALVARLKAALGRPRDLEAAKEMLRSLQNRNDLYQASAREIESILSSLNRQVPAPRPLEAPSAALREASTEEWGVNMVVQASKHLVLELQKHDHHVLEARGVALGTVIILDGKTIVRFLAAECAKTFEFGDGGQKVIAKITAQFATSGRFKSFELRLDDKLVYHLP